MPWTKKQKAAIGAAIGAKEGKTKLKKDGAAASFSKLSREKLGKMMKEPTKPSSEDINKIASELSEEFISEMHNQKPTDKKFCQTCGLYTPFETQGDAIICKQCHSKTYPKGHPKFGGSTKQMGDYAAGKTISPAVDPNSFTLNR
jgi:NADH pyrophosphatase NudC (nudix superfamily)